MIESKHDVYESAYVVGKKKLNELLNLDVDEFLDAVHKNNGLKTHYCAQCQPSPEDGITRAHAEYYVKGRIYAFESDRQVPYRSYLCSDHLHMLLEDGRITEDEKTKIEYVECTYRWLRELDEITTKYTGYDNFRQMCRNNPTLIPFPTATREEIEEYRKIRHAYKMVTGVEAHGKEEYTKIALKRRN